ncbi:MAG: hypothetical protein AAGI50_00870 [Pseudomonadota bacterium]
MAFDVEGRWFAIVSRAKYAPDAVAFVQSAGPEALQERTQRDVPQIIEEPEIRRLKIVDPNGQLIEFFRLVGQ